MKRMSLLVACGIVVSAALSSPIAQAEQQHKRQHGQQTQSNAPPPPPRSTNGRQMVPRGDLRGDIASNARARIGSPIPDPPSHH